MIKCSKCNCRIVRQLWIVDTVIFCSPACERYTEKWENDHRYCDRIVKKIGVAGLKKEKRFNSA